MYVSSRDAGYHGHRFKRQNELRILISADWDTNGLSINHTWTIISNNDDTFYIGTIGGGLNILTYRKGQTNYTIERVTMH